jgi:hypothetical protein
VNGQVAEAMFHVKLDGETAAISTASVSRGEPKRKQILADLFHVELDGETIAI